MFQKNFNRKNMIAVSGFLLLIVFITTINASNTTDKKASINDVQSHMDDKVPELMGYYKIPGSSIAVIKNGEVKWFEHYGYRDVEEEKEVNDYTYFRADSITKSVTAWGIMNLVENGEIKLDDPVQLYLNDWQFPETKYNEENITIRQLLSHSSGITGKFDREELPKKERPLLTDVLDGQYRLAETKLVREPGTKFDYSNQGFMVLELLIEDVTGMDFDVYIKEEVLHPMGIHNATFDINENVRPNLAKSYYLNGKEVEMYVDYFKGAGGLLINVEELAEFFAHSIRGYTNESEENKILNQSSIQALYTKEIETSGFYKLGSEATGLGHFIEILSNDEKAVFHGGEGTGSLSQAYIIPEKGEGIVILTNSKRSYPFLFEVIDDWSELRGIPTPEMSRAFAIAVTMVRGFIIIVSFAIFYKIIKFIKKIISNKVYFDPLLKQERKRKLIQSITALFILIIWWVAGEIVITNLIPTTYDRLGVSILVYTIVVIFVSMFSYSTRWVNER